MPLSFVGVGAKAEHNNADGTPALHGSTIENDLILCAGILRGENATAGACTLNGVGSGYSSIANFIHSTGSPCPRLFVSYKKAGAGEGAPTVDITPLITANTCIYQCATIRGQDLASPIDVVGTASENASAANIGPISGLTPSIPNGMIVVVGVRCDDWTSVADLTGESLTWVEIDEPISILGQDAGLVWAYALYSGSPPAISNKTFTVTGGANHKGLGVMFSIKPAVAAASEPDEPPARNYQHIVVR